jgi:YHS domain-containing protein
MSKFSSFWFSEYLRIENGVTPDKVALHSKKLHWFDCTRCNHSFEKSPKDIVEQKESCPFCTKTKYRLCGKTNCTHYLEKSFGSHERAVDWSDENGIEPHKVALQSNDIYLFVCNNDKCGHTFEAKPNKIVGRGGWCPYCANKELCSDNKCKSCRDKSFVSHEHATDWIKNKNDTTPREVFKGSHDEYWFKCSECKHNFKTSLHSITTSNSWCPHCNSNKLCDNDDCKICFDKSLASMPYAKYFIPNADVKNPRHITKQNGKQCTFKCQECKNSFDMTPSDVYRGRWCPTCKHKTEKKLYGVLNNLYDNVKFQPRFDWCKSDQDRICPFDFYISGKYIIIELDGKQHFSDIMNWKSSDDNLKQDVFKMERANKKVFVSFDCINQMYF